MKFRQASNHYKRVLEAVKLAYVNKRVYHFQETWLLGLGELLIVTLIKVNLLYLIYLTALKYCLLHLIKQNCLLKTFPRTLVLMTQVSFYLLSLLGLIWNYVLFL